MLKILSVFAALNLCTTVAMAAGRVVPSRSVADSVRSEETTPNTAERAGQSKNSRGVATREVPKVVAREGAKSNENSAGANARRGANADSDSRTTNARTQRSATATRSVANARGGATAAKSTATATASRVATTNVARTANRSVKSDVAKGVRASVTGLYTGFTPPPPKDVV